MLKVVHLPTVLVTSTVPPIPVTIFLTIESHKPVLWIVEAILLCVDILANLSNTCASSASGIHTHESLTEKVSQDSLSFISVPIIHSTSHFSGVYL